MTNKGEYVLHDTNCLIIWELWFKRFKIKLILIKEKAIFGPERLIENYLYLILFI